MSSDGTGVENAEELPEIGITFTFPLPFFVPLPDGLKWRVRMRGWNFCRCAGIDSFPPFVDAVFRRRDVAVRDLAPLDLADALNAFHGSPASSVPIQVFDNLPPVSTSYVSLETPILFMESERHDCEARFASREDPTLFYRALGALNSMIRAMRNATLIEGLSELDGRDLGVLVALGIRLSDMSWQPGGYAFRNLERWAPIETLPERAMRHIIGRHWDYEWHHPFLTARTLRLNASFHKFDRGDYTRSVLDMNTAVESLLFDVLRMTEIDRAAKLGEPERVTGRIPLARLMKSTLPSVLGGNWTGGAVNAYRNDLYKLRNAVVHEAARPNGDEVDSARDAMNGMFSFVEGRVLEKWKDYPRTAMALLGEDLRGSPVASTRSYKETLGRVRAEGLYWLGRERPDTYHTHATSWIDFPPNPSSGGLK